MSALPFVGLVLLGGVLIFAVGVAFRRPTTAKSKEPRTYTIEEIDSMRQNMGSIMASRNGYIRGTNVTESEIEDRLRVYLAANVDPKDLYETARNERREALWRSAS